MQALVQKWLAAIFLKFAIIHARDAYLDSHGSIVSTRNFSGTGILPASHPTTTYHMQPVPLLLSNICKSQLVFALFPIS